MAITVDSRRIWPRFWAICCLMLSLLTACAAGVFTAPDNWLQARRFSLVEAPVDTNITIVAVDSKSLAAIGKWPWPRSIHAQIINKLVAARVNQIAFDIDFSTTSNAADDDALYDALKAAGGTTILAGFKQGDALNQLDTVPLARFAEQAWTGTVSVRPDRDGIVRSVPYSENLASNPTPSLAAYIAQAQGSDQSDITIDFAISDSSFDVISAIDLLEDRVPNERIAGKDVIIGATAVELRDLFLTPRGDIVPGSVLQAMAAETAKNGRSIFTPNLAYLALGFVLIGLTGIFASKRSLRTQVTIYVALLVLIELFALVLQWKLHISLPTTGWNIAFAALAAISTFGELGLRRLWIGKIQKRLGATRALLQEVIADSPAGVVVADDQGIIRVANIAARQILSIIQPDLVGRQLKDVLPRELVHLFDQQSLPRQQQVQVKLSGDALRTLEYSLTRSTIATDEDGATSTAAICLTFEDVTERQEHLQRLSYLALHDPLTDARNRNSFVEDLELMARQGSSFAVVHLGLDRFKSINEDFGHTVGDLLLADFASRAKHLLSGEGQLYRVAGDEFACLIDRSSPENAQVIAERLLTLGGARKLDNYEIQSNLSIGIASGSASDCDAAELLRRSGLALASAKAAGGNKICTFNTELDEAARRRKTLESALANALANNELHLLYQPQFDLASGKCIGVESLLRWSNPSLGSVQPSDFIPIAEQIGAIEEIGAWVIETACRDIATLSNNLQVAVNVSVRQFARGNLADIVASALSHSGLPPERLEVEVTESVLADNTDQVVDTLKALRSKNVAVALDDFGTGYSSLSYLLNLPLDKIKIDKSFINGLPHDAKAKAVLASILGVAKALSLATIAEGVETVEQREALAQAGCQHGQGYLFSRPIDIDSLRIFLNLLDHESVIDPPNPLARIHEQATSKAQPGMAAIEPAKKLSA